MGIQLLLCPVSIVSIVNPSLCVWVRRLVSGAGDIKLTKDGNVLLHEMVSRCRAVKWL